MDNFWWGMLFIMFYIPFLFLWGFTLVDVFTRKDLHAWSKMLWAIGILFVPFIGVFAYFISRPKDYDRGLACLTPTQVLTRPLPTTRRTRDRLRRRVRSQTSQRCPLCMTRA